MNICLHEKPWSSDYGWRSECKWILLDPASLGVYPAIHSLHVPRACSVPAVLLDSQDSVPEIKWSPMGYVEIKMGGMRKAAET